MNSTTVAMEKEFHPLSPNCVKINSEFVLCLMISLHYLACVINMSTGIYAICKYYIKIQTDMLLSLRLSCVICTLLFILSDIDTAIDFTFAVQCNKHSYNWTTKYDALGSIFSVLSYFFLSYIFIYKIYLSFKDSIFALSRSTIIFLASFCVILTIIVFADRCLRYAGVITSGYITVIIGLILYIIINLLLMKILISKLLLYAAFQKVAIRGSANSNNNNNINNNNNDISTRLYQTIIKLFIVYSTAILSTIIGTAFVFIWLLILNASGNVIYLQMTFRLSFYIDHLFNIICLLYQHDAADGLYKKTCCICHRCITKICQKNMFHVSQTISNMQCHIESTQSA